MKESKGKKRRRSAAAATAPASTKAAEVDTSAKETPAQPSTNSAIKLSNRRKMKEQGKPKTDGLFLPNRIEAKNTATNKVATSTPDPKRRKLASSMSTPKFLPRNDEMQIDPEQANATEGESTTMNDKNDIISHVSIFLSSTASSSSRPISLEKSPERKAEKINDGNDFIAVERDNNSTTTATATKKDPIDSIAFLATYLENTNDNNEIATNNVNSVITVTREDIATLLLPWSVARLMRWISTVESVDPANDSANIITKEDRVIFNLAWKALSCSFEHLSGSSSEGTVLSNALSQGTLMRLVPLALKVSFDQSKRRKSFDDDIGCADKTGKESIDDKVQVYASNCFLQLARRFRPSLEVACKSLLSEVDELVVQLSSSMTSSCYFASSSSSGQEIVANNDGIQSEFPRSCLHLPQHQARIAFATLEMIHNLMKNANAKRLFGIISSTDVLPRLARLGMVEEEMTAIPDDGATKNEVPAVVVNQHKQLLKSILWDGLFHPVHHMDGFRTMGDLRVMPKLPKLSFESDGPGSADVDNAVMEEKRTFGSENEVANDKDARSDAIKKKCYQAGLFSSLNSILSGEEKVENKESIDTLQGRDVIAVASILPLLIGGFFERVRGRNTVPGKTSSSAGALTTTEADAQLQFRFWCHVIVPTVTKLFSLYSDSNVRDDRLVLSLLVSMAETLKQVLDHDAYLPSYNDPDEEHLSFLDCVTKGLQLIIRKDKNVSTRINSNAKHQEANALISSFHYLILLNHRLVHERLPDVISFSCAQLHPVTHFNPSKKQPKCQANELLSSIIKIYRELRQMKHFLSSTRKSFLVSKVCHREAESLQRVLSCGNIVESLSTAYQICPSGQIHEIWEFFDEWTLEITRRGGTTNDDAAGSNEHDSSTELSFCVQMFIIFIKNVRTNKHNSTDIRMFSEKTMGSSVATLLGNDISHESTSKRSDYFLRQGLNLCGWLVDIHTRACFWIENLHVSDHGMFSLLSQDASQNKNLDVLAYLRNVVDTTLASDHYFDWKNSYLDRYWKSASDDDSQQQMEGIEIPVHLRASLQRLALHRIHQLHSMIYYRKRDEYERAEKEGENPLAASNLLVKEAKMLVNFSVYLASFSRDRLSSCIGSESLWSSLVQSLGIWIQYSDSFHVDIFLVWFFTALCQSNNISTNGTIQLHHTDKVTAISLLRDASFYDIHQLSASFFTLAIKFAMRHVIGTVDSIGQSSETVLMLRKELSHWPDQTQSEWHTFLNYANFVRTGCNNQKISSIKRYDEVSTCLSILASAPLELSVSSENISLMEGLVTIDLIVSNAMKKLEQAERSDWTKLEKALATNRCIIAGILSRLLKDERTNSCLDILNDQLLNILPSSGNGLLSSTSDALSEMLVYCVEYSEKDTTILRSFFDKFNVLIEDKAKDETAFRIKSTLARAIIRKMNMLLRRNNFVTKNETSSKKSAYDLFFEITKTLRRNMWKSIIRRISFNKNSCCNSATSYALLLASEMLSFWGYCFRRVNNSDLLDEELRSTYKDDVVKVFELVSSSYHEFSTTLDNFDSLKYFLASMTACSQYLLFCIPPHAVIETIMNFMNISFVVKRDSPLLEAALCSLIKDAQLDHMEFITTHALKPPEQPAYATKIFFLLITLVKSQEQIKHLASLSETFLAIMMGLVRSKYDTSSEEAANVALFSKAAAALVSRKEFLLLSGREIAMILCEMSPFLFIGRRGKELDASDDFIIFKSCCSVISAMVAHYPKQLYGCPSPLFNLLLALLTHLLNTTPKTGLVPKALEYAR